MQTKQLVIAECESLPGGRKHHKQGLPNWHRHGRLMCYSLRASQYVPENGCVQICPPTHPPPSGLRAHLTIEVSLWLQAKAGSCFREAFSWQVVGLSAYRLISLSAEWIRQVPSPSSSPGRRYISNSLVWPLAKCETRRAFCRSDAVVLGVCFMGHPALFPQGSLVQLSATGWKWQIGTVLPFGRSLVTKRRRFLIRDSASRCWPWPSMHQTVFLWLNTPASGSTKFRGSQNPRKIQNVWPRPHHNLSGELWSNPWNRNSRQVEQPAVEAWAPVAHWIPPFFSELFYGRVLIPLNSTNQERMPIPSFFPWKSTGGI